jgi:hypothetical protein
VSTCRVTSNSWCKVEGLWRKLSNLLQRSLLEVTPVALDTIRVPSAETSPSLLADTMVGTPATQDAVKI